VLIPPLVENSSSAAVDALLSLRHPTRPGSRKVPLPLRKLLPDPAHEEGWLMLTHQVGHLTPSQLRARAWRLRVAIALCDPDDVPRWAVEHLGRLEAVA
jgi:hypothetical protein